MSEADGLVRAKESGFSLLEMLLVLGILALVMGLVAPSIRGERQSSAVTIARQIEALLHRARTDAIAHGRRATVVVDLDAGVVRYGEAESVTIPSSLSRSLLVGRELVAVDGNASVVFQADGSSSGAELKLQNGRDSSASLTVPWLTGVPRVCVPGKTGLCLHDKS